MIMTVLCFLSFFIVHVREHIKKIGQTRISLSGKLLLSISSLISNKCDLFFILFGRFDVKGAQVNNLTDMLGL